MTAASRESVAERRSRSAGRSPAGRRGCNRRRPAPRPALIAPILAAAVAALGPAAATAAPGPTVYVANGGSSSVTPIDTSSGRAGRTISLPGLLPVAIAVTPNGKTAFVVAVGSDEDGSPGSVIAIDTATGALAKPIAVGPSPQSILVSPNGKTAYVLGGLDAATTPATTPVTVTPLATATDLAGRPVKVGTLPRLMVLSPNGKLLYVLDNSPDAAERPSGITPLDTSADAAGALIKVAAEDVAFAPNGKTAYAIATPAGVVPIDTATGKPGKAIPVLPADPIDLAVTPDGKTVEVLGMPDAGLETGSPSGDDWTLTPIATASDRVGSVIKLGANTGSSGGMVVIAPNGATAYVLAAGSSTRPGSVIPVDLTSGSVGKPISVGRDAFDLEIAPDGADLYVLDSGVDNGVGSPTNTAGALVTIATATDTARKPVAVGLAPDAFAIAPAPAGPPAAPAAAAAAASHAENLVVTSSVKSQLVAAFAPAHHVSVAQIAGTYPGSVFYAYDPTTKTYWAEAFFVPARSDPPRVAETFQDAGANGVFSRSAGGAWRYLGGGAPLTCAQERFVPRAVVAVWGLPTSSPSCRSG